LRNIIAYVSNIQRFSVHDGPGIRTVVFLLGCPLRCKWCQNPETFNAKPRLMMNYDKCVGCGACVQVCPRKAISFGESGRIITDYDKCDGCWLCVNECYYQARQLTGKPYTVEEVFLEVKKDEVFYRDTGGGVTLSGGEPLLQPEFCFELFQESGKYSIETAVETCGYTDWKNFERILPVTNLFLYDMKLLDGNKHKKWTGVDNELILKNAKKLVKAGKKLIVRIPLIPGVNDDREEFGSIVRFVKELGSVDSIHITPFHQIGSSKYEMMGVEYALKGLNEENACNIEHCKQIAVDMGFKVSIGGAGFKEDTEAARKPATRKFFLYDI
jgi:pyruvate formate lyase activating enzyme